jgi:hypothetical protein
MEGFDASPDALALVATLTGGGDARITLDDTSGLNRYLSAPYPRSVLAYSSSTVSDISVDAFAHLLATSAERSAQSYAARLDALRGRICAAYGISADTEIVFAPSGTDLEYVALALALERSDQGIHNVLLGADETGSGCIHSAHGRFFAGETALAGGMAMPPRQRRQRGDCAGRHDLAGCIAIGRHQFQGLQPGQDLGFVVVRAHFVSATGDATMLEELAVIGEDRNTTFLLERWRLLCRWRAFDPKGERLRVALLDAVLCCADEKLIFRVCRRDLGGVGLVES